MDDPQEKYPEILRMFEDVTALGKDLLAENERLRSRIDDVEAKNVEFEERVSQAEEYNDILQSLFVTTHRLSSTLDPDQVIETIKEILLNLVGAAEFGVWMLDEETKEFKLIAGEGLQQTDLVDAEVELLEDVLAGKAWYTSDPSSSPVAIVALRVNEEPVGLICMRRLLSHKKELGEIDRQILGVLSEQAATSLVAARLFSGR